MKPKKTNPSLTAHLASQPGRAIVRRSDEQIAKEATRQRLDLIQDARELGNTLLDVWDE